jgi:hypothetical protein
LVITLSVLLIGAGMTVALAAVARPKANAALKTIVFIMVQLSPVSRPSRTHSRSGIGRGAKLPADLAKAMAAELQRMLGQTPAKRRAI